MLVEVLEESTHVVKHNNNVLYTLIFMFSICFGAVSEFVMGGKRDGNFCL